MCFEGGCGGGDGGGCSSGGYNLCGGDAGDSVPAYSAPYSAPASDYYAPASDYYAPAADFGDLSYLSGSNTGAVADTGMGQPAFNEAPISADFGAAPPNYSDFGASPPIYGDTALPVNASPTSGLMPTWDATPVPGPSGATTPAPAFSFESLNYGGPPGASSVPNATVLNEGFAGVYPHTSPGTSMENPAGFSSPASGVSAAGGGLSTTMEGTANSSGGGDLSAKGGKDDNWLTSLGVKNPLGTAIAAGAMGYNMFQSKAMADSLKGPTGMSPGANLAELAAPAMATGRELTAEGRDIGRTGVDDLRIRAATTDPNASGLINKGTGLTNYVGTGTLPPEMQAQVDQAKSDAKTARISFYASKGMPVDPTKNTSLRSDLERIDREAIVMGGQMADQLAKTGTGIIDSGSKLNQVSGGFEKSAADIGSGFVNSGIASSGLAGTTYAQLARMDEAQTERTSKAIAAMAAALSGNNVSNAASRMP